MKIPEFKNLFDFEYRLKEIGKLIKSGQIQNYLDQDEYKTILKKHSSVERVRSLITDSFR